MKSEFTEAIENGQYNKASRLVKQALAEADSPKQIDPIIISSARTLAEKCSTQGDYMGAAALLRTLVEAQKQSMGADHPEVQETTRQLVCALMQTGGVSPKLLTLTEV